MVQQRYDQIDFPIGEYLIRYRRHIAAGVIVILALIVLSSTFYSVQADSEAVVLRFGKYIRTAQPGLHGKLPWPIEQAHLVQVQRIQSLEFGFATVTPGRVTRYATPTTEQNTVARMLTGDLNLAHVEWILQYRISDAYNYLFKIGGSATPAVAINDTIRDVSEAVMRKLVGDASVDEVITIGRDQIASDAKVQIQEMLNQFDAGIEIVTVKLQSATPPDAVKDAFDEVNRAKQNKERVINDARGERNRQIPASRGRRDRAISEAEGYRERIVRTMTGRVDAFLSQLAEYRKAPEVTRTRLYLQTMEEVLSRVDNKIIIDASVRSILPLLNLSAEGFSTATQQGGAK